MHMTLHYFSVHGSSLKCELSLWISLPWLSTFTVRAQSLCGMYVLFRSWQNMLREPKQSIFLQTKAFVVVHACNSKKIQLV